MKPWHVRVLSYLVLTVLYASAIFGFQGYLQRKCEVQVKDKPGLAEIRSIAEQNKLSSYEINFALKKTEMKTWGFHLLFGSQLVSVGFVLASYGIVHALVSRLVKRNQEKAQPRPARYRR